MSRYDRMNRAELIAALKASTPAKSTRTAKTGKDAATPSPGSTRIARIPSDTKERLHAILQTAIDGIITIDHQGVIDSVNPAAERMFGHTAKTMIGRNINMLMPAPFRDNHDTYINNYLHTGHAKIIGIGREVLGLRKDGTIFPMDLSVSEVKLPDRRMFTGFVRDITERKSMEREILHISEMEQRRIGQDLHDGLCQQLAGVEFMSQALEQALAAKDKTNAAAAARISGLIRDAISQTRDLAKGLSPVILEPDGLMAALDLLAANVRHLFRVQCRYHRDRPVLLKDNSVATHLFRIAQEAINNAIRHGEATRIEIRLTSTPQRIILAVHDNGKGMPDKQPTGKGMGLRIMQYRAGMIGGSLAIQRQQGTGTSVVCSIHRQPNSLVNPTPTTAFHDRQKKVRKRKT